MVLRRVRRTAAGGDSPGDEHVDFLPAFAARADDDFVGFLGLRERLADQGAEEGLGRQHGLDGIADDVHESRVLAAEAVVEGEAERGKEGLGPIEVFYRQIEDDLFVHGVFWLSWSGQSRTAIRRRMATPEIDMTLEISCSSWSGERGRSSGGFRLGEFCQTGFG